MSAPANSTDNAAIAKAALCKRRVNYTTGMALRKIQKMADGSLEIEGTATSEAIDSHGDIMAHEGNVIAFEGWAGNIREMHQLKAVGRKLEIVPLTDARRIDVRSFISAGAPDTVRLLEDGVLRAYSIGGTVLEAEEIETADGRKVRKVTSWEMDELSVVDVGANPDSNNVKVLKIDGSALADAEEVPVKKTAAKNEKAKTGNLYRDAIVKEVDGAPVAAAEEEDPAAPKTDEPPAGDPPAEDPPAGDPPADPPAPPAPAAKAKTPVEVKALGARLRKFMYDWQDEGDDLCAAVCAIRMIRALIQAEAAELVRDGGALEGPGLAALRLAEAQVFVYLQSEAAEFAGIVAALPADNAGVDAVMDAADEPGADEPADTGGAPAAKDDMGAAKDEMGAAKAASRRIVRALANAAIAARLDKLEKASADVFTREDAKALSVAISERIPGKGVFDAIRTGLENVKKSVSAIAAAPQAGRVPLSADTGRYGAGVVKSEGGHASEATETAIVRSLFEQMRASAPGQVANWITEYSRDYLPKQDERRG